MDRKKGMIEILANSLAHFRKIISTSPDRWGYEGNPYEPFLLKLEAAINFIDKQNTFSPNNRILKKHLRFLKSGVAKGIGLQLLVDGGKNVDENNYKQVSDQRHDIQDNLFILNMNMQYLCKEVNDMTNIDIGTGKEEIKR